MERYTVPLAKHRVNDAQLEAARAEGFVALDAVCGWGAGVPDDATTLRLLLPPRVDVASMLNATHWALALRRHRPSLAIEFDMRFTNLATYGVAHRGVVAELIRPASLLDGVRCLISSDAAIARSVWRQVGSTEASLVPR
jgi:hypothetical protein